MGNIDNNDAKVLSINNQWKSQLSSQQEVNHKDPTQRTNDIIDQ